MGNCKNCDKPQAEHQDTVYGGQTRCKIEGAKMYFNLNHWSGQTMIQLAEEFNLQPCKCSKYQCWDCAREEKYKCIDEYENEYLQHVLTKTKYDEYKCTRCKKKFMLRITE